MVSENNFPHMAGLASQSSLCPHRLVQDGQTQHSVNPGQAERLNANLSIELKSKVQFLQRSTTRKILLASSR